MRFIDPYGRWVWVVNSKSLINGKPYSINKNMFNERIPINNLYGEGFKNYSESEASAIQNRINSYADKWGNSVPAIADWLKNETIAIATETNSVPEFRGQRQNGGILFNESLIGSADEEGTVFHELVHDLLMRKKGYGSGETEFHAYASQFAMGLTNKKYISNQIKAGKFRGGIPSQFTKYFNQGYLREEKSDEFWNEYSKFGENINSGL